MSEITTLGLDLAKNVFVASGASAIHVHGADASGLGVLRKKLRRDQVLAFFSQLQPCVVAMEACGGAHFWGREIGKLGHDLRLILPAYVKPFVKRQKMGWLPPSLDGIAMCQGRGVQRHKKERTANERYNDRCGLGKERLPASRRQLGRALEVSQEGDTGSVSAFHGKAQTCRRGDGGVWQRELLGAGDDQQSLQRPLAQLPDGILLHVAKSFLGRELTASQHRHDLPPLRASPTFARFSRHIIDFSLKRCAFCRFGLQGFVCFPPKPCNFGSGHEAPSAP